MSEMFELTDTRPDVNVQEAEYLRLLGFPRHHVLEGRARELADWAREWFGSNAKPWIHAREAEALRLARGRVVINGTEFSSGELHDQFAEAGAKKAVLVAVSAGAECEQRGGELWQEGKPDEYFFLEVFGSAVVEHLVTIANGRICGWADSKARFALPHFSPGYSNWDVAEQSKLMALIAGMPGRALPGELQVMETGMLRPKKSLLAVVGITADAVKAGSLARLVPCEGCSLPGCAYRRAPYKRSPRQIEGVQWSQNAVGEEAADGGAAAPPLTRDAKYSVNARAIRKWAAERLQLKTLGDGSVEARFCYEGTTCSSMGQPLEFHYHVKLAPRGERYRIVEADCAPATGDTGHTKQCEYLNDAASLMRHISSEKPLLGLPLNEVLSWERRWNPSGCYCDLERRNHKWGVVYEVIHFALSERESGAAAA